ncbi:MAG: LD-carboxypeptidase [Cyclobacteriaceae bacterium]|nr:LD-carboxypeptidase [Cyclobacteriaceae bacterium]
MIQPPKLVEGNKVAIVAPAGKIIENTLDNGVKQIESWRLNISFGKYLQKGHHYFSGTDEERLYDLQSALDNPDIKAIFCARGGYGVTRILDAIDFSKFIKHPKWIIGFSDVTALHFKLHKLGFQSIHSVMPTGFLSANEASTEGLRKILFGEDNTYVLDNNNTFNRKGEAKAIIIGGNLSLINDSLGTSTEVDFDKKILFIEEIDEYLYKIDRMLVQLKRANKLTNLAGLIVGHITDTKDTNVPFGKSANELILEHVKGFNYPVAFNIPIGHESLNLAIQHSGICHLKIDDKVTLSFN